MSSLDRRNLLRRGAAAAAGVLLGGAAARAAGIVTPPQTEGPFYPVNDQIDKDADLTKSLDGARRALGEHVIVQGVVLDTNNKPISGALVDVWQACASGRYNHPRDPNTTAAVDPNFQYWARLLTDNEGRFEFRTVVPGAYPANAGWDRPPHIHFRVDAWGRKRLTTQMYFKGQELNEKDQILLDTAQRYGRAAMESLIVEFKDANHVSGKRVGFFTMTLGSTPQVD